MWVSYEFKCMKGSEYLNTYQELGITETERILLTKL